MAAHKGDPANHTAESDTVAILGRWPLFLKISVHDTVPRVYKGLQVGRYLENKGGEQMQVLPLAAIAKEAAHVGSNN